MDPQLFILLQDFYSLKPTNKLNFPKGVSPTKINDFLLIDILFDSHFQQYPPSQQYQKQFWKWAIENLEQMPVEDNDDDFEVDVSIYKHYFSLLPSSGLVIGLSHPETQNQICGRGIALHTAAPSNSYVTHFWRPYPMSDPEVVDALVDLKHYQRTTLLESRTTIESGTTGLRTWLASFVLAEYLIAHPNVLTTSSNVDINYSTLDWSAAIDIERKKMLQVFLQQQVNADIILGADVVFDPALIPALIATLKMALSPKESNKQGLIALTMRNPSTLQQFINQANEAFQVEDIHTGSPQRLFSETLEGRTEDVKLFLIRL
ncbi:hypothetical protein CVT24_001784 [Panaeolus cyanescens]|uniref:Uncharacterized protein n=1 Tax=Panaeolus cyanescens TaxID=181874 RepID=A0A409YUF4_9AGAR|nr:hypothetical protein CVT24_001784 [Panaeolus cyanescens]